MTLLARRREEIARESDRDEAPEERRSVVVRPHPIQRSFLHVQEAIGNGAAERLLRLRRPSQSSPARHGQLVAHELAPALGLAAETQKRQRFIVPDGVAPWPGQITRAAFVSTVEESARLAAEEGLAELNRTARDCPLIEHYHRLYSLRGADRIETDVLRYVPAARLARSAEDYVAAVTAHVRASVLRWTRTGELVGVPRGLPGSELAAAIRSTEVAEPRAVQSRLGEGRPLGGDARSRMERAFRTNLGQVRIHTDENAAREAHGQKARAFTVGRHIAFGPDQYKPGSVVGDALLAHEVAHTLQQRSAESTAPKSGATSQRFERDAHISAAGVLARLWAGATELGSDMSRLAFPRLRGGLALARCGGDKFTDAELQAYLDYIDEHGPEGDNDSDNKARAVVREFRGGSGKFPLNDWLVWNLIEEMLKGAVLADDETQIFELLRRSDNDRLEYLFGEHRLTPKRVLADIGGQAEEDVKKFFELRFEGGKAAVEAGTVEPRGKPYPDPERLADLQLEMLREEAKQKKLEKLEEERKRRERERKREAKEKKESGESSEDDVTAEPPPLTPADVTVDASDLADELKAKASEEVEEEESIEPWLKIEKKEGGVAEYLAFARETIEKVRNAAKKSPKFEEIVKMLDEAPPQFNAKIAKDALRDDWFGVARGESFEVSMSWLETAHKQPKQVFANIAHEVGGHIFLTKKGKLSTEISTKVLEALPAEDRRALFSDPDMSQAFHDAFRYPETELFAELRERKYYAMGFTKGGDNPDTNIPELLAKIKKNWHPDVSRAILTHVVDIARVTEGIRETDIEFLINKINGADLGFEIR